MPQLPPSSPATPETPPLEIRSYYVRERNALLVRGDFGELYTDFYLHAMEHKLNYPNSQADLLKDGFAALALHLASRPRNEAAAWTLSWQDPLQNLFLTGSNRYGNLTGRAFTEDIRPRETHLLFAQTTADGHEPRQSIIEVDRLDWFAIGEKYYEQSEQRRGRYFCHHDEDHVLVTAQPDCDLDWLESLNGENIVQVGQENTLTLLETRHYRFHCGCNLDRIFPIIGSMNAASLEELFQGEEVLAASCPRCGARYSVTREALEAYLDRPSPGAATPEATDSV